MVDYREILRLRSLEYKQTEIAQAVHSSRNTIREVEKLADAKGISWPLEEELTNQRLYELFYPDRLEKAQVYLEPDCAYIHKELAKKGVNRNRQIIGSIFAHFHRSFSCFLLPLSFHLIGLCQAYHICLVFAHVF